MRLIEFSTFKDRYTPISSLLFCCELNMPLYNRGSLQIIILQNLHILKQVETMDQVTLSQLFNGFRQILDILAGIQAQSRSWDISKGRAWSLQSLEYIELVGCTTGFGQQVGSPFYNKSILSFSISQYMCLYDKLYFPDEIFWQNFPISSCSKPL